ncbi:MAG TPA: hypothetical protein VGI54_11740 [Solirubrobacteraceae bacterium]
MAAEATLELPRLEQVRERLRDRDWREVTTEELARAAGLSRMTLHRRGLAKAEILAQLGAELEAEHREAAFAALVLRAPARERLQRALEAMCDVNERYLRIIDALGTAIQVLFHEPGDGPVMTRATFTEALRRIVEDGVAEGTVEAEDPVELATLLFNATSHTYRHMRTGHHWPPERARERVVALLLDGVVR